MELHRLAGADEVAHRDHTRIGVGAEHVPHEEVAAAEGVAILARGPADVQRGSHEFPINGVEFLKGFPQPFKRRPTAEFDDHVLFRPGDYHRPPHGPAALGDDWPHPDTPADHHSDSPGIVGAGAGRERVGAGLVAAARHASDDWHARVLLLESADEGIDRKREGIGHEDQGGVGRPLARQTLRPAGEHPAVGSLGVFEREGLNPAAGQAGQPDRHGRPRLLLLATGHDALRGAAQHMPGRHQVAEEFEHRPDCRAIGGRDEHEGEVGERAGAIGSEAAGRRIAAKQVGHSRVRRLPKGELQPWIGRAAAAAPQPGAGVSPLPRLHVTISANDATAACSETPPGSRLPGRTANAVAMPAPRAASNSAPTSLTNRICRGSSPMSAAIAV